MTGQHFRRVLAVLIVACALAQFVATTLVILVGLQGIPAEQLDRVFEPFYRLESSRSRETGGAGQGLSVARDCAQAHGGRLILRNGSTGGLESELSLPRGGGSSLLPV